MPRKVYDGPATGTAQITTPEQPPEWAPRPLPGSWWQTCVDRDALAGRLLTSFAGPACRRDQTRRRGLIRLLDWLERQPGGDLAGQVAGERRGRGRLRLGRAAAG